MAPCCVHPDACAARVACGAQQPSSAHALFLFFSGDAPYCAPFARRSRSRLLVNLLLFRPCPVPACQTYGTLQVQGDDLDGRFSFRLHASRAMRPGLTPGRRSGIGLGGGGGGGGGGSGGSGGDRERGKGPGRKGPGRGGGGARLPFEAGRPSLEVKGSYRARN